jgi:hypothetical protein
LGYLTFDFSINKRRARQINFFEKVERHFYFFYRFAVGFAANRREQELSIEQEYVALYSATDPPGNPLPVHYHPVPISDCIPSDEEILAAVRSLKAGKAPGPSGMRVDDFKRWSRETEEEPWQRLLALVKHCFANQEVPKSATLSTLVLIPKSDGGVRGIGLLESVWKVISMVIKK